MSAEPATRSASPAPVSRTIERRPAHGDVDSLPEALHPVLRRVYAQRGVSSSADLDLRLARLVPPDQLPGAVDAAEILTDALANEEDVVIIGDYDADGATATAVMVRTLEAAAAASGSASRIHYRVPDRFRFGYGLTPEVVDTVRDLGAGVLMTVDNGVSSVEGSRAAREAGMRVVVTDHHLPGETLPDVDALVNPNAGPGAGGPLRALAGVGVAFYVALALRAHWREQEIPGWEDLSPAHDLDLVALGTVADLVPLDFNNRLLVEQGLRRIRSGATRPGIQALVDSAGRRTSGIVSADLAFGVAPRLNAAGRMDDMRLGVACLLATTQDDAHALVARLEQLNRERRDVQSRMTEEAMETIPDEAGLGLCVADPGWHEGVTGIVASRLKERYERPVMAFAPAETGGWKGSGRSVDGVHLRDLLAEVDRRAPGLLQRFGGHAMAAGLTLRDEGLEPFRLLFAEVLDEHLGGELPQQRLRTDGALSGSELTLETAFALRHGGPWGVGFEEPAFDGVFEMSELQLMKGGHLRCRLAPYADPDGRDERGKGAPVPAIAFGGVERGWHELEGLVRVVYRLDVNEYRGRTQLQLRMEHLERHLAGARAVT